jgi:hypothetical protein
MLVIIVGIHILDVRGMDNFASSSHRRLRERCSGAQSFQYSCLFELLFEAFQGFVD